MLKTKIYKEHFPVKERVTSFNDKEKGILKKWTARFETELKEREIYMENRQLRSGVKEYVLVTYRLKDYDVTELNQMIDSNCFDDKNLAFINLVLYANQYPFFMHPYLFPILTQEKADSIFGKQIFREG